jgi:hypothetical protein
MLDLEPQHGLVVSLIGSATRNLWATDPSGTAVVNSSSSTSVGTAQTEGRVSWALGKVASVSLGVRGSWITGPAEAVGAQPRFQWSAFTAVAAAYRGVL